MNNNSTPQNSSHHFIRNSSILFLSAIFSLQSFARTADEINQIKSTFNLINRSSKGALDINSYQTQTGRLPVFVNGQVTNPPRNNVFTVAFPSSLATQLENYNFFVGLHFTSAYYELHSKYIATEDEKNQTGFILNHAAFLQNTTMADEARLRLKHMLMEKFFDVKNPRSRIALGMQQRGTADANSEKKFYSMLVDYLAKNIQTDQDYLHLFEVQRTWNLSGDSSQISLNKLRDDVANIYSQINAITVASSGNRTQSQMDVSFRGIRNSIHNYMTPDVQNRLKSFITNYDSILDENIKSLILNLQGNIDLYYSINKTEIINFINKTKIARYLPTNTSDVLNNINEQPGQIASVQQLEQLSQLMVSIKQNFMNSRVADLLHLEIRLNAYLQSQINQTNLENDWQSRSRIALDCLYVSGLVSQNSYSSLRTQWSTPTSITSEQARLIKQDIENLNSQAHSLSDSMLQPALADWIAVDAKTEGIIDDMMRSSMLTEFDQIHTLLESKNTSQNTSGFNNGNFKIEQEGIGYGYLVLVKKGSSDDDIAKLDRTAIPIFEELPLYLGVVSGIISLQPQTALSHISIKSKSRGTPDAYIPNATNLPLINDLLARRALVRVSFKDNQIEIREASRQEAQTAWANKKAPNKVEIKADLSEKRIRMTSEMHSSDVLTVGAKTANYGEASRALPAGVIQNGLGIPFFYYKEFIETNMYDASTTLAGQIAKIIKDPRSKAATPEDRQFLIQALTDLQERMKAQDMKINPNLVASLKIKLEQMYPGLAIRFRSSTNSEDLPNFSGAGLYDSYSYDPQKPKKTIESALKKTWASVWNIRAFDERSLFEIDHLKVYMAILVCPAFQTEVANGVAVTRNTVDPKLGPGTYINTQVGGNAVTNPDPNATPEELLVLKNGIQYISNSSMVVNDIENKYTVCNPQQKHIMCDNEVNQLNSYLMKIHNHFKKIMDPQNKNPKFAMDMEFKVDVREGQRKIFIKQARPYIGK